MERFAVRLLRWFSKRVLRKYRPQVVAVTGSYGKTGAKDAIACVLAEAYDVRRSLQSYNNEFGVPFTVLGVQPGSNRLATFARASFAGLRLLLTRQQEPAVLVLEMGADKPGDIRNILRFVPVHIAVLTGVGPAHLEHFGTVEAVLEEKALIAHAVAEHGWTVLNGDDARLRPLAEQAPSRIVSYGFDEGNAVRCLDTAVSRNELTAEWGMLLTVQAHQDRITVFLPGVTGKHSAYAALAAISVGLALHLDIPEIVNGLQRYEPAAGRMRVLDGVNAATLIDDTYNSSPDACVAAIKGLREFPAEGKRIAMLGDMVDLGKVTEEAHRRIGRAIAEQQIDLFIGVGKSMRIAAEEAKAAGMQADRVLTFDNPVGAAKAAQGRLGAGDVVLLKGSQASRMEKATKELLENPANAGKLLVRQYGKWLLS